MNVLYPFALGALMIAFAAIGAFFVKFWRKSGDRLFAWFALAFFLLSLNQLGFVLLNEHNERTVIYVVRLIAFAIIIWGIVDKNRRS